MCWVGISAFKHTHKKLPENPNTANKTPKRYDSANRNLVNSIFVNVKAIVPILRNQCEQVWFQIEDTEAMLLQNQSGSSWLENPGETVVCVSLCIQHRSKSNFKKELSNGRET